MIVCHLIADPWGVTLNANGIVRLEGSARGRSRATIWNGLVFTVAAAPGSGETIAEQTRATLDVLASNLADVGSRPDLILSATVFIADIGSKAEMDAEWNAWVGESGRWPQRACVQVTLTAGTLVEVTVIAVTDIGGDADRVGREENRA